MAKFNRIAFVILWLAMAACCCAEPPRYQSTKRIHLGRVRFFARQEASPAPTPYPSAEELKPEVLFEEGIAPDQTYGPPDQTYGPPDATDNNVEQLPNDEDPEVFAPNPDAEEFASALDKTTEAVIPARLRQRDNKSTKPRLQAIRLNQNQRRKTERLVAAPGTIEAAPIPVAIPLQAQHLRLVSQPFAYTPQVHVW